MAPGRQPTLPRLRHLCISGHTRRTLARVLGSNLFRHAFTYLACIIFFFLSAEVFKALHEFVALSHVLLGNAW